MIKICRGCGESKDYLDFHKNRRAMDGLQARCKSCMSESSKSWVEKNRERRRGYQREYHFLYGRHGKGRDRAGYLDGQGFCVWCGELFPLLLEQHHPFGAKESDFILSFCANHHKIASLYPNFMKEWTGYSS